MLSIGLGLTSVPVLARRGGLAAPYLGPVATRGYFPNRIHATNTQIMSQTRHLARDAISSLRLAFVNAYLGTTDPIAEQLAGSAMTVTASVSKSTSGPWTPFSFSGVAAGSVADGAIGLSDELSFSISNGEAFYVRAWKGWSGAGRAVYAENTADVNNGELFRIGTSVPDNTASGTFTGNSNPMFGGPSAVLGMTKKASVALIGDSICYGFDDAYVSNPSGDIGSLARSIGPSLAYLSVARSSDSVLAFRTSCAIRTQLAAYASHIVCNFGRNDLDNARTAAQVKADLLYVRSLFAGKPFWLSTITPKSTSSDGFATTANQTVASTNAQRAILNNDLRSGSFGATGVFDVAAGVENDAPGNDGRWAPLQTTDGLHPNAAGYQTIKTSGAVNPALLTR